MTLKAPFPYFGGKSQVVDVCWRAFGPDVPNYVEPAFGSGAMLLGRPGGAGKLETINDLNCWVTNFYRAVQRDPEAVAHWADWPVSEVDMHARHLWLVNGMAEHRERMMTDPDYFDVQRAGWWVWGQSMWIGHGWCDGKHLLKKRPLCDKPGRGVHQEGVRLSRQKPHTGGRAGIFRQRIPSVGHSGRGTHSPEAPPLAEWFCELSERLRYVRILCGDWSRVVSGAVTGASNTLNNMGMSPCAVFLDPPYNVPDRMHGIYAEDSLDVSPAMREWAIANGDNPKLRIILAGYEGEHDMPSSWRVCAWKSKGGFGNRAGNQNATRERLWLSPHCLPLEERQRGLFDGMEAT